MNDVQRVLLAARCLISYPEDWTQHTMARDDVDAPTLPTADYACKWCAVGAIVAVCPERRIRLRGRVVMALRNAAGIYPQAVNDHGAPERAHAATLRMFDAAIILAA